MGPPPCLCFSYTGLLRFSGRRHAYHASTCSAYVVDPSEQIHSPPGPGARRPAPRSGPKSLFHHPAWIVVLPAIAVYSSHNVHTNTPSSFPSAIRCKRPYGRAPSSSDPHLHHLRSHASIRTIGGTPSKLESHRLHSTSLLLYLVFACVRRPTSTSPALRRPFARSGAIGRPLIIPFDHSRGVLYRSSSPNHHHHHRSSSLARSRLAVIVNTSSEDCS